MKEEKLLRLLRKEFGENFDIFSKNNNTEFYIVGDLCSYACVCFKITQKYLLEAFILERTTYHCRTGINLYGVKLETEEQVIQLIKTGYHHLKNEYETIGSILCLKNALICVLFIKVSI